MDYLGGGIIYSHTLYLLNGDIMTLESSTQSVRDTMLWKLRSKTFSDGLWVSVQPRINRYPI